MAENHEHGKNTPQQYLTESLEIFSSLVRLGNTMVTKWFSSSKVKPSRGGEKEHYLVEEYLQNASLSLNATIQQLHYASVWLHKYHADAMDVDVMLETLKAYAKELDALQQRYQ
jgi:hypothetical protein